MFFILNFYILLHNSIVDVNVNVVKNKMIVAI